MTVHRWLLACWLAAWTPAAGLSLDKRAGKPRPTPASLAAWLDTTFDGLWKQAGVTAAPRADDATFLRRATLDLVGTIPPVPQTREFLADRSPDKRQKLIARLLADPRYPQHWARVWRRIMVPSSSPQANLAGLLEPWLKKQLAERVGYDQLARNLLVASGGYQDGSPVMFYLAAGNEPPLVAAAFSRVFLGVRIGCAQCHNHPFASWKRDDFWGMAAFFAGTNTTGRFTYQVQDDKRSKIKAPDSNKEYRARLLDGTDPKIPADALPRAVLGQWMTAPKNPYFAATAVNRVWQQLLGKALTTSVDDLDQATQQERAQVLDELAARFVAAGYDLRWLIEGICQSKVYQLASERVSPGENNELFTAMSLKVLSAEQVFDALEQALLLPIAADMASPRYNGQRQRLIGQFNESLGNTPEQYKAGVPQALTMMNGELVSAGTDVHQSRTLRAVIDAPFLAPAEKIETLYLAALTRRPRPEELTPLLGIVAEQKGPTVERAYADIFWAILNSPEFVLNH